MQVANIVVLLILATYGLADDGAIHRMIGGTVTSIRCHKFQAAVLYKSVFRCGAIILSHSWILTAAHCTVKAQLKPENFDFRMGSTWHRTGGVTMHAKKIIVHEKYEHEAVRFDAALFELAFPVVFTDTIGPVSMPPSFRDIPVGDLAVVTGWGSTHHGGLVSEQLQVIRVKIVGQEDCQQRYNTTKHRIYPEMVCAADKGQDSCSGDSGGPMIVNGVLEGIVSWGYKCGNENLPGVYCRVAHVRDWIRQHTGL